MMLPGSHHLAVEPCEVADVVGTYHAIRGSRELELFEIALAPHLSFDNREHVEPSSSQRRNPI